MDTFVSYLRIPVKKYRSFGECLESQGTLGTDKLFTGQRLDDTGLYYYGARYYDPSIGRFISPDPMTHSEPLPKGQVIKALTVYPNTTQFYTPDTRFPTYINPQEHNRYSYALNNPLRYTDPDGHQAEAAFAVAGGAVWIPGWGWAIAGGAVIVGGAIILEQQTGCFSSAWESIKGAAGNIGSWLSSRFSEATTGDPNQNPFKSKWHRMSIMDTKPFMLPAIQHSNFAQRPPVRESHGLTADAAFDRRSQYTR
jgi:RHS repeat-associated protein